MENDISHLSESVHVKFHEYMIGGKWKAARTLLKEYKIIKGRCTKFCTRDMLIMNHKLWWIMGELKGVQKHPESIV